jgi:hypothetical protein
MLSGVLKWVSVGEILSCLFQYMAIASQLLSHIMQYISCSSRTVITRFAICPSWVVSAARSLNKPLLLHKYIYCYK